MSDPNDAAALTAVVLREEESRREAQAAAEAGELLPDDLLPGVGGALMPLRDGLKTGGLVMIFALLLVSMIETLPLSQEALAVKNTIVHAMSELGQHLLSLLTGFYEERQTPLPCRLVIQSNGLGSYTLLNQGAIVGLPSDQETLKAYQDEFMAFAEYLKSIWG